MQSAATWRVAPKSNACGFVYQHFNELKFVNRFEYL